MNLILQYYEPIIISRQEEINYVLKKNINNNFIKKIYLLNEKIYDLKSKNIVSDKITQINIGERLSFQTAFEFANKYCKNTICILSLADIYYDDSLSLLNSINFDNVVMCMLKHEIIKDNKLIISTKKNKKLKKTVIDNTAQDCWIFKPILKKLFPNDNIKSPYLDKNHKMGGQWGCDGKIAYILHSVGIKIYNPAYSINCIHYHFNDIKRKSKGQLKKIEGPYLSITPTKIDNMDDTILKKY